MRVIITETLNRQSFSRGEINVRSISAAKSAADRARVYQGTFLRIVDAETGETLATRDTGMHGWQGRWKTGGITD